MATLAQDQNVPGDQESQIAAVLEYRYGDGLVYLPRNHPRLLNTLSRKNGFIDAGGYMTRKGRVLLARYYFSCISSLLTLLYFLYKAL